MPVNLPTEDLEAAESAVEYAQMVRKYHARRTEKGHPQREADIEQALGRLKQAMRPLKSAIGRFHHEPQTTIAIRNRQPIYDASDQIKKERQKLWKMQSR